MRAESTLPGDAVPETRLLPPMALSLVLGCAWAQIVSTLAGRGFEFIRWPIALSGAFTGLLMGALTIWSRRRRAGRESVIWVGLTYYLAMLLWFVLGRLVVVFVYGREWPKNFWYGFDFLFVYGTGFGLVLIPLCWLSRILVWRSYQRPLAS